MAPSPRDHEQFHRLIARLHAVAEKHGDLVFAHALTDCAVNASGGKPECPMAVLLLEDYAKTGERPHVMAPPSGGSLPLTAGDPPPYDRQGLLQYVHRVLEEQALLRRDVRYLEALQSCQKMMKEDDSCPMHRFLRAPQQPE
jgi:hypothetical protein